MDAAGLERFQSDILASMQSDPRSNLSVDESGMGVPDLVEDVVAERLVVLARPEVIVLHQRIHP